MASNLYYHLCSLIQLYSKKIHIRCTVYVYIIYICKILMQHTNIPIECCTLRKNILSVEQVIISVLGSLCSLNQGVDSSITNEAYKLSYTKFQLGFIPLTTSFFPMAPHLRMLLLHMITGQVIDNTGLN